MKVVRLTPAHAAEYRAHMLAAYAADPEAFTATVSEREALPLEFWRARVSDDPAASEMVLGAFDGERLAGVAGLRFFRRPGTRHKAWLFGMTVRPELRRRGIGRALVEAVLEQARIRPETRVVQLTVSEVNGAARRLYEACGFRAFGTEPLAVRVGERFLARVHMWRALEREGDRIEEATPTMSEKADERKGAPGQ